MLNAQHITHQKEHIDRLVIAVGDLFQLQREQVRIKNIFAGALNLFDISGFGDLADTVVVCAQRQAGRSASGPGRTGRRLV